MPFKKILIAVNGNEYSMKAARVGLELAQELEANVGLLYVIDIAKSMGNIEAGITHETALLVLTKAAEETLDQLAKMYKGNNLVKLMPEGLPREDVIKTAEVWEADLLVVGTHSKSGIAHLISGSTAEHIVRHSKIPVMVVPCK
jgi:nucleotide-binding universal stress UspA family protein